jgi:AcrR family transcriptional regulator
MCAEPIRLDRRHLRRQESIEQVLRHAVDVMADQGVAGLSLGEVARRMGVRTPSLYGYFESKNAIYDAVFARGWTDLGERLRAVRSTAEGGLLDVLLASGTVYLRWNVEHPVQAQLMSWRPVPGYTPSQEAYAAAVEVYADNLAQFSELKRRRLLRKGVSADTALRAWTCLLSGVMTQQLANAPDESFEEGRFTTMFPQLLQMYLCHYATTN